MVPSGGEGRPRMLCKWINATVSSASRGEFAAAQRSWVAIGDQAGLIGQVGGWDPDGGLAHVLALWSDLDSYRLFMSGRHAAVVDHGGQRSTYTDIETAVGVIVFTMPGDVGEDLLAAMRRAAVLRVADCRVAPGHDEHFIAVQRGVWAPGMAAAGGMLAGWFTRLGRHRYLVTTLWSDPAAHRRYAAEDVPRLRARAHLSDDLQEMTGLAIPLEPSWRVLGHI